MVVENAKIPEIRPSKVRSSFITYEERIVLYDYYNKLDQIYMRGVNKIIEEEMPKEIRQNGDEITLNMDNMENNTLRKLESYVFECLGKQKEDIPKEVKLEKEPTRIESLYQIIPEPKQEENINETKEPSGKIEEMESSESQSSSSESEDSSSSDSSEDNDNENNLFISPKSNFKNKITNGLNNTQLPEPKSVMI